MLNNFLKGQVPKVWKSEYSIWKTITVSQWIADLSSRVKHLEQYRTIATNPNDPKRKLQGPFWLGGLFYPEAFITATRQVVAEVNCLILYLH